MAKFLDNTGLSYFVDKLKSKFVTQSEYGLPIYYVETGDAPTPSGGSTYTLTTIAPQQTVVSTSPPAGDQDMLELTSTEGLVEGDYYLVTVNGVVRAQTAVRNNYVLYLSDIQDCWYDGNRTVLMASNTLYFCPWAAGTYTVKVEHLEFVDDGTTLINKTITANGAYNASSDGADGYSSVTVNVPSGSPSLQSKSVTYTPTTSQQTDSVTADSGYDGLSGVNVTVNAMPTGTEGTPTASKGTVSNHAVTVTPSVTNSAGYISGGTKTGTGVSVSASELVSGSQTITENGTVDVTNLETVVVSVSGGGASVDTKTLTNDSDTATSLAFTGMKGTPKAFILRCTSQLTRSSSYSYYYVTAVRYNGTNTNGNYWRRSNGTFYNDSSHYSFSYSGTTLTISSSASRGAAGGSFYNGNYELVYVY